MSKPKSVIVIGSGITGVAAAINLQERNIQTTLVDPGKIERAASYGNGGVIACCACVPVPTPTLIKTIPQLLTNADSPLFVTWSKVPKILPWLSRYLLNANDNKVNFISEQLNKLLADGVNQHKNLVAKSAAKKYLQNSDYLYIYQNSDSMLADDYAWSIRKDYGFNPKVVKDKELADLAGSLVTNESCGYLVNDHAMVTDPGKYIKELINTFVDAGGKVVTNQVRNIIPSPDQVEVEIHDNKLTAEAVVITAGVWSWKLARPFGANIKIESERGYHIELTGADAASLPIMATQYKLAITPMENRIRLSGMVDLSGLDETPNQNAQLLLRKLAQKLYPSSNYKEAQIWMGHRPAPWDSLPLLGRLPASNRLFMAAGLHHVGLTGGPKLGKLVAQIINQEATDIDVSPFSPDRL